MDWGKWHSGVGMLCVWGGVKEVEGQSWEQTVQPGLWGTLREGCLCRSASSMLGVVSEVSQIGLVRMEPEPEQEGWCTSGPTGTGLGTCCVGGHTQEQGWTAQSGVRRWVIIGSSLPAGIVQGCL